MRFILSTIFIANLATATNSYLLAESRSDGTTTAVLIYNRIAGMPPSAAVIGEMADLIHKGDVPAAALIATNSYGFYNIKLRNMFGAWSNASSSSNVSLNDMVATMIGMVRDDIPFNQVLTGDFIYIGEAQGLPPYQLNSNDHYVQLQRLDLRIAMKQAKQSEITEQPEEAQAGVISTRAFAESFFKAGTNRRATAFTLKNFLCKEMESLHDTSLTDKKVRHDVNRTPGGDREVYNHRCKGCHAPMDAISGWSVYYNFLQNTAIYTPGSVQTKVIDPDTTQYADGHLPADDSFENLWVASKDNELGWQTDQSIGRGANDYGKMLTSSAAFATCMATHVWQQVCLTMPERTQETTARDELGQRFAKNNYNLKQLFAATAARCLL